MRMRLLTHFFQMGNGHVRGHGPGDVELRRDEHDEHLDLLRGAGGDGGDVRQRLNILMPVRALLTARRDEPPSSFLSTMSYVTFSLGAFITSSSFFST